MELNNIKVNISFNDEELSEIGFMYLYFLSAKVNESIEDEEKGKYEIDVEGFKWLYEEFFEKIKFFYKLAVVDEISKEATLIKALKERNKIEL